MQRATLRLAAAAHLTLLLATSATLFAAIEAIPARAIAIAVAAAPLLVTFPGLVRGRRAVLPWLAVLLVPFVGATVIEVIATRAPFAGIALFAALAELALVLALTRRPAASSG